MDVTNHLVQPTRVVTRKPVCFFKNILKKLPPLFGLAPSGVCPAIRVTTYAVRSYRTFSPLPKPINSFRRYIFCGTFPRVAPAGRYPALCPRGARTFLS